MEHDERRELCILAAVDLSAAGDDALRAAMRLVRPDGGSVLHVVHVIEVASSLHDANEVDELSRTLDAKLEALEERVRRVVPEGEAGWSHDAVLHVRLGEPAEAIHQAAVDVDADFIVVGTHGRTGIEKLKHGSVAERLVRAARIPVVVAHPKDIADLPKSDRPEPPRPGEDLTPTGISARLHLEFLPRTTHISGLV